MVKYSHYLGLSTHVLDYVDLLDPYNYQFPVL